VRRRSRKRNKYQSLIVTWRLKTISKARFDALAFLRRPATKLIVEEKEWYADQDENVLGVVTLDRPDHDWGYVVLWSDERSLFRAIEVDVSLPDLETVRRNLHLRLSFYSVTGEKIFPQVKKPNERNLRSSG
jgi:hypothetical protein